MGMMGKKLFYGYYYPNLSTSYEGNLDKNALYSDDITVSKDIEVGKNAKLFQVDIYDSTIAVDFKSASVWRASGFNGPVITDKSDVLNDIIGFRLQTNMVGLDSSDVHFSKDSIGINFAGLASTDRTYIFLTVKFERIEVMGTKSNETLTGSDLDDNMLGHAGDDVLKGVDGDDRLYGGAGDDTLTGGKGDDHFVFKADEGSDRITDFNADKEDHDTIVLSLVREITNYKDLVENHMHDDGKDVVIDLGGGDTVTVDNVSMKDLSRSDFWV
jgi:Ca2+-binding RTX toxin-like protein